MTDERAKRYAMGLLGNYPPAGALSPGLLQQPAPQDYARGLLGQAAEQVFSQNRGLDRYRDIFNITQKETKPDDPRQIEYYPPWEDWNPTPGKATLELYNTTQNPTLLQNLLQGDMMHYVGSVDPRNNQAVDPTFRALKQEFRQNLTPEQLAVDQRAYQNMAGMYDRVPAFDDWMDFSRVDAYLRGYLTPDERDEWRKQAGYTPKQIEILEKMRRYLQKGSLAPGMQR